MIPLAARTPEAATKRDTDLAHYQPPLTRWQSSGPSLPTAVALDGTPVRGISSSVASFRKIISPD